MNRKISLRLLSFVVSLALVFQFAGSGLAIGPVIDLSQGQEDVVIRGEFEDGTLGEVAATGDFDGDNVADLLLGSPGASPSGKANAGAAYVILGNGNNSNSFNLAGTPPILTIYGANAGDILGHSVAVGDVDNDGLSDIVIGADRVNAGGNLRGAVYVFLGADLDFSQTTLIDMASPSISPALTVQGEFDGGRLGRAVAVGDVDGDGIHDIVVGAYLASPTGRAEAGAVYMVKGSADMDSDSPITVNVSSAAVRIYGGQGSTNAGILAVQALENQVHPLFADEVLAPLAGRGDRLGRSVAAADVNGDGIADMITGAYGADVNGQVDAGKTYVFYGNEDYRSGTTTIDLGNGGTADVTINGVDGGDESGFYVAAGKVNRDNNADILIGAYRSDGFNNGAGNEAGEVYLLYGTNWSSETTLNLATQSNLTVYGAEGDDRLGRSLAIADVNNNGYEDLLIGASRADPDGRANAGAAFVIDGSKAGAGVLRLDQSPDVYLTVYGHVGGTVCTVDEEAGAIMGDCPDELGRALSGGDFNGDGINDIVVSAPFGNNNSLTNAGAVYVIYGEQAGFQLHLPLVNK